MDEQNTTPQAQQPEAGIVRDLANPGREKLAALQQAGRNPFEETTYEVDAYAKDINENSTNMRKTGIRCRSDPLQTRYGKSQGFIDIQDQSGRIQSYVRKDHLGDEEYEWFKKYDIGDIIGIKGEVFRTQKGQISVKADEVKLLSKSLLPLPEKWHGLKDTELRYRQRYVDLIVNPDVKKAFVMRSKFIRHMRIIWMSGAILKWKRLC